MLRFAGCVLVLFAAVQARADSYQVLYNFSGGTSDGQYPTGSLILSGTTLYGVTGNGGTADDGTVFSYDLATDGEAILHSFTGGTTDGDLPIGPLVLAGSNLYGVTVLDGSAGDGTVFSVNTVNNNETLLHSFTGGPTDGNFPEGPLVQVGSIIYGTTQKGGSNNDGTIFGFNNNFYNGISVVHSFSGTAADGFGTPNGNLVDTGSTIYGLNQFGGGAGDVFAYNTSNNSVSAVSYFNGNNGAEPISLTESTQLSSIFYGITQLGGSEDAGVLFELNAGNGSESVLHAFGTLSDDGIYPNTSLIESGGVLYGLVGDGGIQGGGSHLLVRYHHRHFHDAP